VLDTNKQKKVTIGDISSCGLIKLIHNTVQNYSTSICSFKVSHIKDSCLEHSGNFLKQKKKQRGSLCRDSTVHPMFR
jgi:hypothetical protein